MLSSWAPRGLACALVVCSACGDDSSDGPDLVADAGRDAASAVDGGTVSDARVELDSSAPMDAAIAVDASPNQDAASMQDAVAALDATAQDSRALDASTDDASVPCNMLTLQVRDFTPATNPDFETFTGAGTGILEPTLDADHLPVFASSKNVVTSRTTFDQWYRDVPTSTSTATSRYR